MSVTDRFVKRRLQIGRWLGVLLGLVLLVLVLRAFDLAEVGRALSSSQLSFLPAIVAVLVASSVLRAFRWGVLFSDKGKMQFRSLFGALMVSHLMNNVLPARAGDLIRAYLLGEREGTSKSVVLGTIVVERVIDLGIALVLLLVVMVSHPLPERLAVVSVAASIACGGLIVALIALNVVGATRVAAVVRRLRFLPERFRAKLEGISEGFIMGVSGLRSSRRLLKFLVVAAMIWSVEITGVWLVGQAFALPLPWSGALLVLLAIGIGTALPAAPGYVGTFEFFGMAALAALGLQGESALAFVLALHAMTFLVSSGIGSLCLGIQRWPVLRNRAREGGAGDP